MFQFYRSTIMTLRVRSARRLAGIVSILQKYDYDSLGKEAMLDTEFMFQFYRSTIMTVIFQPDLTPSTLFQFYRSTIMTNASIVYVIGCLCFNSTEVRLWPDIGYPTVAAPQFQFYRSTIMTMFCPLVVTTFLSFNSTEVRLWRLGKQAMLDTEFMFQFYRSTIMTLFFPLFLY